MQQLFYSPALCVMKSNIWQTILLQRNLDGWLPLCVSFVAPSLLAYSRKPAAEGGEAQASEHICTFKQMPWWPLKIRRRSHVVFYRKKWRVKKESSLLLHVSNLPHRIQSHLSIHWSCRYSHRVSILLTGRERIQHHISATDAAKAFLIVRNFHFGQCFLREAIEDEY